MKEARNGFSRVVEYKGSQLIPFPQRVPGLRDGRARERGTIGVRLLLHAPKLSSKLNELSTLRRVFSSDVASSTVRLTGFSQRE
jgi:hypothetical protein